MTSSQQSTNTVLRLVANAAGAWFDIKSNDPNLPVVQNHSDPGVATDLAAIKVEDDTWYALVTLMNSKAVVDAAGAWCETAKKLYVAQTQDSVCRDTAISGTDDVMESTKNAALKHTSAWYSNRTSDFLDAGILGVVLPYDPGSWTAAFKEIAGVPAGRTPARSARTSPARTATSTSRRPAPISPGRASRPKASSSTSRSSSTGSRRGWPRPSSRSS
jgi:hypothetical protein